MSIHIAVGLVPVKPVFCNWWRPLWYWVLLCGEEWDCNGGIWEFKMWEIGGADGGLCIECAGEFGWCSWRNVWGMLYIPLCMISLSWPYTWWMVIISVGLPISWLCLIKVLLVPSQICVVWSVEWLYYSDFVISSPDWYVHIALNHVSKKALKW